MKLAASTHLPARTWIRLGRRTLTHAVLMIGLSAWAVPTATLPSELEPYFAAIKQVESRGHPWSIFDNTTRQSYRLNSRAEAEAKARELIRYGHNLDLGLMQLNCRYQCTREGVSLDNIFDPAVNVAIAKTVFLEFWDQARRVSTEFLSRVMAAVGAYNNGRVHLPNPGYLDKVWRVLGRSVSEIPNDGRGTPAGTVATAADAFGGSASPTPRAAPQSTGPRASRMDDTLGRAGSGSAWQRERLAAVADDGTSARQRRQAADGGPSAREVAEMGMGAGLVAVFGIGAAVFVVCIKFFGLLKVMRFMRLASAVTKRKDDR